MISPHIDPADLARLGVAGDGARNVGPFTTGQSAYLGYHRSVVCLA
jgi:hypothetical protein